MTVAIVVVWYREYLLWLKGFIHFLFEVPEVDLTRKPLRLGVPLVF
jgi:hypothetical protein